MGAAKSGEGQLAGIGLALRHTHSGAFLVNLFNFQNIGKVQLRVHALSEHVESNSDDIEIARALAVAKKGALDAVCTCHQGQLGRCYAGSAVIVRMDTNNSSLAVLHIAAEVFNLVGIGVRSAHFHGGWQVNDDGLFLGSTHLCHHSLANSDGKIDFRAGEAFGRVFIANIHTTASHLFLGELLDETCALYSDFGNAFHILAKYNLALQGGGGVIEVDDYIFSATHCFKGFANELLARLHQNLHRNIIRNVPTFD